jgi:DNA polymerase III delta subunit
LKFYDFLDKSPPIGRLVIIEGTEQLLVARALDAILERLLPVDVRDLNLTKIRAEGVGDAASVREAVQAMPFLAERRVVVVGDAENLRAQERRDLWEAAQSVPEGSTLVIVDMLPPRSQRPQGFGSIAGRGAMRVDTTADVETRHRFVRETLADLEASAAPAVISALVESSADLAAVHNDLQKLALNGKKITIAALEHESLNVADPKAWRYASALVEGKSSQALAIAQELFAQSPREAAIPLLSALATEYSLLWDLARPNGRIPERLRWRERILRPIAKRIGEARAKRGYERAVRGIEAIVTGRAGSDPEDYRTLVERISAECAV